MPRTLALLALAALSLVLPARAQEALRIEGLQGRVETLGRAERVELLTGLGPRDASGPGLLEAGSMASARLYWPARASLLVQGRAGLEWHDTQDLSLRVFELQHGELEVRRGPLQLELPWCWNASFGTGAWRLRSLPGGALEIETVAGTPPRLWWSRGALIRPFAGPAAGERVQLAPGWSPPTSGVPERHGPWSLVSWPWGEAPDSLRVTLEPAAPLAPAPEPAAPAPALAPPAPPFDARLWHGLAREELELVGRIALERRDDLAFERTEHGGFTLRLHSQATRPAWVLREGSDLELAPGTLVLLDESGALLANLGSIRSQAHAPERLAPAVSGIAPRP